MSDMILHCGGHTVDRSVLETVELPERTRTWTPVRHTAVLDRVEDVLDANGFRIQKETHALAKQGKRYFGVLDLVNELAPGTTLSVGIRNSIDKSFPLGFCAGSRTFVCDNLAFSAQLVVSKRHTTYGEQLFQEAITGAVGALDQFRVAETQRLTFLRNTIVTPIEAESMILRAFETQVVTARQLPHVVAAFRSPAFDWGPQDRLWHLFNSMNSPMQERAVKSPARFARQTMQLMALLLKGRYLGTDGAAESADVEATFAVLPDGAPDDDGGEDD